MQPLVVRFMRPLAVRFMRPLVVRLMQPLVVRFMQPVVVRFMQVPVVVRFMQGYRDAEAFQKIPAETDGNNRGSKTGPSPPDPWTNMPPKLMKTFLGYAPL